MYEVRVEARFSAAHQVRLYDGELEPLHGHDWRLEAIFRGSRLDSIGVLIDFVPVQAALEEVAKLFHHTRLNDVALFEGINPTAEHVARIAYDELKRRLPADAPLAGVYVTEAPGCVAGCFPAL